MRFRAALVALFMTLAMVVPASAGNRVQWYYGLQPPSSWMDQSSKNPYVAQGQLLWDIIGRSNTSGFFTNAQIVPNTGMYVQISPINASQYASLYQIGVIDTAPFGSVGNGALPADSNQIFHQALLNTTSNSVGPLTAPSVVGDSVKDLIECQVQIVDSNTQSVNFVTSTNIASQSTANRDRNDVWSCQAKLGSQATTGSEVAPTVDAGWIAVGTVDIPYGTSTVTSGMIVTNANWNGFLPAGSATTFVDLTSNQTVAGNKTFSGITAISNYLQFTNSTVTLPNLPSIASDYQASPGMLLEAASGSQGFRFYINNVLKGQIDNGGFYWAGSSNYGPTSMNVNGTATIGGGTFDGTTLKAKSASYLALNGFGVGYPVDVNYNNSSTSGLAVYDGGTVNKANLLSTGLSFSGASTSSYTSTDATVYGNLVMPNQAAGQCAQFDASHHIVAAGGACGLTSGTINSVTSADSNLLATTTSGAVSLDIVNAPQFKSLFALTPDAATGYNVYVSSATGTETKQNATPIAIGTGWTEPTSGLIAGSALPTTDKAGLPSGPANPTLGSSAAGSIGATTYYAKLTYVNNSGESVYASGETSLAVAANNVLTVASPAANSPANSVAEIVFGNDQQEALTRSGSAFKFAPWIGGSGNPTVEADGGFISGSSQYYPTYATVNGMLTSAGVTSSGALYLTATTGAGTSSDYISRTGADNLVFQTTDTSGSFTFRNGVTTSAALNTAGWALGSSTYGPTSATVNGNVTAQGGLFANGGAGITGNPFYLSGGISGALGEMYTDLNSTVYITAPSAVSQNNPNILQLGNSTFTCGLCLKNGAGFTMQPLSAPAAPTLGQSAAGTIGATTYFAKITYKNANGETTASSESSLAVSANNVLVVTSPIASNSASSYNVYVSTATGTETLQASSIAIGTNWTEPTTGLIAGAALPASNTATGKFAVGNIVLAANYINAAGPVSAGNNLWLQMFDDGTSTWVKNIHASSAYFGNANGWGHLDTSDNWVLDQNGAYKTASSSYGATSATVNGNVTAQASNALPNVSDNNSVATFEGTAFKLGFGVLNTATNALSYGCLANATKPCRITSGGDTINTVATTAFESSIAGTKALFGADANGNLGVANTVYASGFSIPDGTAPGTLLLGNTGVATSGTNYASSTLKFDNSFWTGSAATTNSWTMSVGGGGNFNVGYNGGVVEYFQPNSIGFSGTASNSIYSSTTGAATGLVINDGGALTGDLLDVQLGGTNKFSVSNGGNVSAGSYTFPAGGYGIGIAGTTNGVINLFTNGVSNARTAFIDGSGGWNVGSSLYGGTSATVAGNLTIPAAGTATSGTNYGSAGNLQFNDSTWNGSTAVTNLWYMGPSTDDNLYIGHAGSTMIKITNTQGLQLGGTLGLTGTGVNTLSSSTTGANTAFVLNAAGTAPTSDLLDVQLGASNKFQVLNGGGVTSQGAGTFVGLNVKNTAQTQTAAFDYGTTNANALTLTCSGTSCLANIYANAFFNTSLRSHKYDIHSITGLDALNLLAKTCWSSFKYKGSLDLRYGYIADCAPSEMAGPKQDHFDAMAVSTFDAVAILQVDRKVTAQTRRVDALENEVHLLSARVAQLEQERAPVQQKSWLQRVFGL